MNAEINLDEEIIAAAFGPCWLDELGIAIWLACLWEQANHYAGVPRDEWDTPRHREMFLEDIEGEEPFDPVRMGWVGRDGRL
jgi:hypothetical protein